MLHKIKRTGETLTGTFCTYHRAPARQTVGAESSGAKERISWLFSHPPQPGSETLHTIYRYLEHPESCCRNLRLAGGRPGRRDGSKLVCEDPPLAPRPHSCLVYSFGVANDWSFDEAMSARGCEVHSFDPSLSRAEGPTEHGTTFHRQGLSGDGNETNTNGWRLMTLKRTMERLGQAGRVLDYLKIDVEGAEWDWLEAADEAVLRQVRQLAMEVHFFDLQMNPTTEMMSDVVDTYYTAFQLLHDMGFCLVSVRENPRNAGRLHLPWLREEKATLFEVLWVKR